MTALQAAISWTGTNVELSLFVVWPTGGQQAIAPPPGLTRPDVVKVYDLDDDSGLLGPMTVAEIDLIFPVIPPDLDQLVEAWLVSSIQAGAALAWFGFEGSFHFEHLLTADVADQVYAVADANTLALGTDDQLRVSAVWAAELAGFRRAVFR